MNQAEPFYCKTYGKWILAGEHAVLRGVPALVFPLKEFSMEFSFAPKAANFHAHFSGEKGDELKIIFWGLIEHALEKLGRERSSLTGDLTIVSNLPLGAGLGASAALCVGIGQFMAHQGWVKPNDVYEFSRQLENLFHGESSGVDIAIALEGRGLRFMRGGERSDVAIHWLPQLYLSYSGKRGVTSECVRRVNELRTLSPHLGDKIDGQMREAVEMSEKALALSATEGFSLLTQSLDKARDCFYQWGLCDGALDQHMKELSRRGALALKPTGSGGGGYVLSLWEAPPPKDLSLIPLF